MAKLGKKKEEKKKKKMKMMMIILVMIEATDVRPSIRPPKQAASALLLRRTQHQARQ